MILLTSGIYSSKSFVGLIEDDLEAPFKAAMLGWRACKNNDEDCHNFAGCEYNLIAYMKNHHPDLWNKIIHFKEINMDDCDWTFRTTDRPCIDD